MTTYLKDGESFSAFDLHGWMLWTSWGLFSLVMLATNRWLRGTMPKSRLNIHMILGTTMMVITITFASWIWHYLKKDAADPIIDNNHSYMAFPTLFCVGVVAVGGFVTRFVLSN